MQQAFLAGISMESQNNNNIQNKIKNMISNTPVILFMKGTPKSPLCGFSAQVVKILDFIKVQYESFNVLEDEDIRQGIKVYGNWPTIPQLYVNGDLFGGCDIVQEKFQSGDLEKELSFASSSKKQN